MRPEVYALIDELDRLAERAKFGRAQRVRQALVDLSRDGSITCMCDDARNLLRARIVRAAVLVVDEWVPWPARGGPASPGSRMPQQKYTGAEADVFADDPWHPESIAFVRAFFGNPKLHWTNRDPWFSDVAYVR